MIRRPPRSTLFPTRRSSDLVGRVGDDVFGEALDADLKRIGVKAHLVRDPSLATDRKSTRLNSSHANISYAVFCLKKKKNPLTTTTYHIHLVQSYHDHTTLSD